MRECKCKTCGKDFMVPVKSGPAPIYCSKKCQRRQYRKRYCSTCEVCGKKFSRSDRQSTCSRQCGGKLRRNNKGTLRKCIICGGYYEPKYKEQQSCSIGCSKKAGVTTRLKNGTAYRINKRRCLGCGKMFRPRKSMYGKFCTPECYYLNNCDRTITSFAERDSYHHHRARHLGCLKETIRPLDIFERDGWDCGVCGKAVNKKLRNPDPMSASLDHIIPMQYKGPHYRDNVRLAHLSCNSSRPKDEGKDWILFDLSDKAGGGTPLSIR